MSTHSVFCFLSVSNVQHLTKQRRQKIIQKIALGGSPSNRFQKNMIHHDNLLPLQSLWCCGFFVWVTTWEWNCHRKGKMIILNTHHWIVPSGCGWSHSRVFSMKCVLEESAKCGTGENKDNWSRMCLSLTYNRNMKWTKWLCVICAIKQDSVLHYSGI